MRYRDLKDERDAAVARAIEAERLSMKSEFDRVNAEFEQEKTRLLAQVSEDVKESYRRGFVAGVDAINDVLLSTSDKIKKWAKEREIEGARTP